MLTPIVTNILRGTPLWVLPLFLGLLALGYLQSRPRDLQPIRVAILPLALGAYSLARVLADFGPAPAHLAAWTAGGAAAILLNLALKQPAGARWSDANGTYHVPGSWLPLALMLAMFFARYALAAGLAMRPALILAPGFAAGVCFALGLLGGMFLARALWVWSRRKALPLIAYV